MMSALFDEVPVVLIHKDNIADYFAKMTHAIREASYLSLDLEMTGLGDRKQLMSKDIEIRYSHMKSVAETRSVLSVGLSCFKKDSVTSNSPESTRFTVETYNIVLLCEEDYVVEPVSLRFLVSHGFDFNQQYAQGISYYRGNDQPDVPVERSRIRDLFSEIVKSKVPVVLHNALVDLVYLYQNFYCQLPSKMDTFLADLSEVFAGGLIDTKYISDYMIRWPASYLEYTFRRCQMENRARLIGGDSHVTVDFPAYPTACSDVEYRVCGLPPDDIAGRSKPCEKYAAHGNCPLRDDCPDSHDIDVILAVEFRDGIQYQEPRHLRKKRRRKRPAESTDGEVGAGDSTTAPTNLNGVEKSPPTNGHDTTTRAGSAGIPPPVVVNKTETGAAASNGPETNLNANVSRTRCEGHRAGFDAFMTGFILAHVLSWKDLMKTDQKIDFAKLPNVLNNIYMSGKDIPLQVRKGSFSKTSKFHNEKLQKLTTTT